MTVPKIGLGPGWCRESDKQMATREFRIAEFNQGAPPPKTSLQVLAEDHSGTYVLPFLCEWRDGAWHNPKSSQSLKAKIVGWRKSPRVR